MYLLVSGRLFTITGRLNNTIAQVRPKLSKLRINRAKGEMGIKKPATLGE
jgi:hypothetical protein